MSQSPPSVAVIVVAAGSGTRLNAGRPKAFVALLGRSILEHCLESVAAWRKGWKAPVTLVVVTHPDYCDEAEAILSEFSAVFTPNSAQVVAGGQTRHASVAAGLAATKNADIVLVHDAARAFTTPELFTRVVEAVSANGFGAIPALPVTDTIKSTDSGGRVLATLDRSELVAVQTPQGFPTTQLVCAYQLAASRGIDAPAVTDDAQLVADAGYPVTVVPGDPGGYKITTKADFYRAERDKRSEEDMRVGIGTDTHAFAGSPDTPLWLACLRWPGQAGLAGHSDGDVVAHAIVDALLSAAGLGDIGAVFGTADPRYAGAHGTEFLIETKQLLEAAHVRIQNVSVQLIGNRPRFAPRRAEAEAEISRLLHAPVSISATTTDGLGFTGRGDGLTAIATALLSCRPGDSKPER